MSAFSRTLDAAAAKLELHQVAREEGFFPYFRALGGESGPTAVMEGRERVMLGSNNYLGLASDARVKAAAHEALERYGTALTGSRLLNGTMELHAELESELAQLMGAEDVLVFATGYQANCGVIGALAGARDAVVCDSADHASILDGVAIAGAQLVPFRHGRLDRLEGALRRARASSESVYVVVDGVFSMEGGLCDLPRVSALCGEYEAGLIVDEAHGAGVLGSHRAGATDLFGLEDVVEVRTGTLSKSFASCGGFVAASREVNQYLRVEARAFVFSAAGVPAAVGAALEAVRICRSPEGAERAERVLANARYLRDGFERLGFPFVVELDRPEELTPIVSIAVGDDIRAMCLWKALYDAGVYVNVSVYPAVPRNGALLRTSVMATHEQQHLDAALAVFERVRAEAEPGFFTRAS